MILTAKDKIYFNKLIKKNINDNKIRTSLLHFINDANITNQLSCSKPALEKALSYFYGTKIDTLSINTYVEALPQILKIQSKSIKTSVNKLIDILFVYVSNNLIDFNLPNLEELRLCLHVFLNDDINYLFGTKILRKKILTTLCNGNGDKEIKRLLIHFIDAEFKKPTNLYFDAKVGVNEYFYGLDKFIYIVRDFSISDISWNTYCFLMQRINKIVPGWNFNGVISGKLNSFMPVGFKYIIEHTNYKSLDNIRILNEYSNYLTPRERLIKSNLKSKYSQYVRSNIFSNFPLNTHPSKLYLVNFEYLSSSKQLLSYQTIINFNTENRFLKELLTSFVDSITIAASDAATRIENRLFIYFFNSSLYSLPFEINDITDFSFKVFKAQFRFFEKIDKIFPLCDTKSVDILKKFYLFLIVYIKSNNYIHNIFEGTAIDERVLSTKKFKARYKQGFSFVFHTPFETPPTSDRLCIVMDSSSSARAPGYICAALDFTSVININYRRDLKNYIWNKRYAHADAVFTDFYIIREFLNLKYFYEIDNSNIIPLEKNTNEVFDENFMFTYMCSILTNHTNESTISNRFGAIKNFLLQNKTLYNYNESLNLYLKISESSKIGGAGGIKIDDFNNIVQVFTENKYKTKYGELLFIILYLKTKTSLRIGEILSLKRNCIVEIHEDSNSGIIKIYSKTEEEETTKIISMECINIINRAKNLTAEFGHNALNKSTAKYIFIKPVYNQSSFQRYTVTSLSSDFYTAFANALKNLDLGGKYRVYDIRHMRKNEIAKAASKKGLDIADITPIIGGTVQTNLRSYINNNETNFYVECFTGTTVANVDVSGNIVSSKKLSNKTYILGNELGSCKESCCSKSTNNDSFIQKLPFVKCLMCDNFLTTPQKVTVFESTIKYVKSLKKVSNNSEEKMLCDIVLQLLGAFYEKLLN